MLSRIQKPRPCVRDHQVVAVDHQVAHADRGQIQLQRLPVVAVVERDRDAQFGGRVEQALARGIFLDGVQIRGLGEPVRGQRPRLAVIARAVDVRLVVFQAMAVDRRPRPSPGSKCEASICVTLLQAASPGGVTFCQVLPPSRVRWIRPVSLPTQISAGAQRRRADRIDHAVARARARSRWSPGTWARRLVLARVAGQIAADLLPGAGRHRWSSAATASRSRACPVRSARRPAAAVHGKRYFCVEMVAANRRAHGPGVMFCACPVRLSKRARRAVGVADVDDVVILRVHRDVAALAAAHRIPVARIDLAVIGAARNHGGAAILLRAVDVVRETDCR